MGTLFAFWIAGYLLGALAWEMKTPVLQYVESIGLSADASQGLLAGLFGSMVMIFAVLSWSFLSAK
jgi:hypothetical protein